MIRPMRTRPAIVLFLFLATGTPAVRADEIDDHDVQEIVRRQIPGLALAVVRDGRLSKATGYGLANVEHQVPVTPATVFQSGSMGKQFTAAAVMMLVEDGKLSLEDSVIRLLKEAPRGWKGITVRHLLTQTSGIKDCTGFLDLRRDYSEDDLMKLAASHPLDFPPGEKWSYSNTGYVLLGRVIRKVTGKFYGYFLRERIFGPLGMETARTISEADIIPNRAAGYRLVNGVLKNQEWVSPSLNTTADGALYLTVLDMAKWDAALYTEKLLTKRSLEQMWTPVRLKNGKTHPYGFGWGLGQVNGRRRIEHGGAWQGFEAFIDRYPDDRLTVVVFANRAGADAGRIAARVAALLIPALNPPVAKPVARRSPRSPQRTRAGSPGPPRNSPGAARPPAPHGLDCLPSAVAFHRRSRGGLPWPRVCPGGSSTGSSASAGRPGGRARPTLGPAVGTDTLAERLHHLRLVPAGFGLQPAAAHPSNARGQLAASGYGEGFEGRAVLRAVQFFPQSCSCSCSSSSSAAVRIRTEREHEPEGAGQLNRPAPCY